VEAWLSSPAVDNLQELEFFYIPHQRPPGLFFSLWQGPVVPPAPSSTFRFAATRCLANIGKCHLPDNTVQGLHFPQLKHLALHWVYISESSIHRLIAECPALECLLIYYISGFRCLRINALRACLTDPVFARPVSSEYRALYQKNCSPRTIPSNRPLISPRIFKNANPGRIHR
jgi:hypothetical protein